MNNNPNDNIEQYICHDKDMNNEYCNNNDDTENAENKNIFKLMEIMTMITKLTIKSGSGGYHEVIISAGRMQIGPEAHIGAWSPFCHMKHGRVCRRPIYLSPTQGLGFFGM